MSVSLSVSHTLAGVREDVAVGWNTRHFCPRNSDSWGTFCDFPVSGEKFKNPAINPAPVISFPVPPFPLKRGCEIGQFCFPSICLYVGYQGLVYAISFSHSHFSRYFLLLFIIFSSALILPLPFFIFS